MTNPPYPLHDIPFQKTSSQWHQTLPGDTEIFASPDAYQQWNATGRPFRPPADTPRQRNPQDSWKPIMSGEMESWSYSTPEAREPIQGFQRRGYQSSPNGSSASRAISPPRQGGLSSPAGFQHTAYVPPRRRGMAPFPPTLPPGTQPVSNRTPANIPFIPFNSSSSGGSREYTPASPFVVKLPPAPYIELSKRSKANSSSDKIVAKLLVLDLNGTLIYRSASRQSGNRRKAYPRPYLSCFLEYLFLPEPWDSDKPPVRPWEVFVWSSAQPINVRAMVEFGFGKKWIEGVYEPESETGRAAREQNGEGRLLGVWARDRMGLHEADYGEILLRGSSSFGSSPKGSDREGFAQAYRTP